MDKEVLRTTAALRKKDDEVEQAKKDIEALKKKLKVLKLEQDVMRRKEKNLRKTQPLFTDLEKQDPLLLKRRNDVMQNIRARIERDEWGDEPSGKEDLPSEEEKGGGGGGHSILPLKKRSKKVTMESPKSTGNETVSAPSLPPITPSTTTSGGSAISPVITLSSEKSKSPHKTRRNTMMAAISPPSSSSSTPSVTSPSSKKDILSSLSGKKKHHPPSPLSLPLPCPEDPSPISLKNSAKEKERERERRGETRPRAGTHYGVISLGKLEGVLREKGGKKGGEDKGGKKGEDKGGKKGGEEKGGKKGGEEKGGEDVVQRGSFPDLEENLSLSFEGPLHQFTGSSSKSNPLSNSGSNSGSNPPPNPPTNPLSNSSGSPLSNSSTSPLPHPLYSSPNPLTNSIPTLPLSSAIVTHVPFEPIVSPSASQSFVNEPIEYSSSPPPVASPAFTSPTHIRPIPFDPIISPSVSSSPPPSSPPTFFLDLPSTLPSSSAPPIIFEPVISPTPSPRKKQRQISSPPLPSSPPNEATSFPLSPSRTPLPPLFQGSSGSSCPTPPTPQLRSPCGFSSPPLPSFDSSSSNSPTSPSNTPPSSPPPKSLPPQTLSNSAHNPLTTPLFSTAPPASSSCNPPGSGSAREPLQNNPALQVQRDATYQPYPPPPSTASCGLTKPTPPPPTTTPPPKTSTPTPTPTTTATTTTTTKTRPTVQPILSNTKNFRSVRSYIPRFPRGPSSSFPPDHSPSAPNLTNPSTTSSNSTPSTSSTSTSSTSSSTKTTHQFFNPSNSSEPSFLFPRSALSPSAPFPSPSTPIPSPTLSPSAPTPKPSSFFPRYQRSFSSDSLASLLQTSNPSKEMNPKTERRGERERERVKGGVILSTSNVYDCYCADLEVGGKEKEKRKGGGSQFLKVPPPPVYGDSSDEEALFEEDEEDEEDDEEEEEGRRSGVSVVSPNSDLSSAASPRSDDEGRGGRWIPQDDGYSEISSSSVTPRSPPPFDEGYTEERSIFSKSQRGKREGKGRAMVLRNRPKTHSSESEGTEENPKYQSLKHASPGRPTTTRVKKDDERKKKWKRAPLWLSLSDPRSIEAQMDAWNFRFQSCLQNLHVLRESSGTEKRIHANIELMHLSQDFIHASRTVGKIIISEVFLPVERKMIRPKTMGGRAGGEKYMVHNIMFKFAVDSANLFQGSTWAAAKVANHELKGLMSYFSLGIKDVFMPLMALVDYRGYRLVAMSVLPVNKSTLIYGTNDAGKTIHKSNKEFNGIMRDTAKTLNLKSHLCGCVKSKTKKLSSAADIEGHLGTDGKFYLLDFSRTMPPVTPIPKHHNGHLYRLMRREFVDQLSAPLCPDSYSGFIVHDKRAKEHNKEIDDATTYLINDIIPDFSQSFSELVEQVERESIDVSVLMHRSGINLRYIGLVIKELKSQMGEEVSALEFCAPKKPTSIRTASALLLLEATARSIKNELNKKLRRKMKQLRLPLEVPYRKISIDFMNVIFGSSQASWQWWQERLPLLLKTFFQIKVYPFEKKSLRDWRAEVYSIGKEILFKRIVKLTGLRFTKEARKKISDQWNYQEPLDLLDLTDMGDRVKDMDIVSFCQGNFFFYKSLKEKEKSITISMLRQAIEKYEQALSSMPSNKETLFQCTLSWFKLLKLKSEQRLGSDDEHGPFNTRLPILDPKEPSVQRTNNYFVNTVKSCPSNPIILCLYAVFLSMKGDWRDAEDHFLKSLELDPDNMYASILYGMFLMERGHPSHYVDIFFHFTESSKIPIDPVTCEELGGRIRIYYPPTSSIKTVAIKATTPASEICHSLCKSFNITEDQEEFSLFKIELGPQARILNPDDIIIGMKKKDVKEVLVGSNEKPWLLVGRPGNNYLLCFKRQEGKREERKGGRSWKKKVFKRRSTVFGTNLVIGNENEFNECFIKETDLLTETLLLCSWPIFTTKEKLVSLLTSQCATNRDKLNAVKGWISAFPVDLDRVVFMNMMENICASALGGENKEGILTMKRRIEAERTEAFEWRRFLDLPLRELRCLLNEKHSYSSPLRSLNWLSLSDRDIKMMAEHLRIWGLSLLSCLDLRNFLIENCPLLQAISTHTKEIQNWVSTSILDHSLPPSLSLDYYHFFCKIAEGAFALSDFLTSSAIAMALGTETIFQFGNIWRCCSNFDKVSSFVRKSKSLTMFSVVLDDTASPFYSHAPWKEKEKPSPEAKKETYFSLLQSRVESRDAFLFCFDWVRKDLDAVGPAVQMDNVSGKRTLHVSKGREIFEIVRRPLQGVAPVVAKQFACGVNTPLVEALALGPLRGVSPLPWIAHAQKQNEHLELAPPTPFSSSSIKWTTEGDDSSSGESRSPPRSVSKGSKIKAGLALTQSSSVSHSPPPARWGFKPPKKEKR